MIFLDYPHSVVRNIFIGLLLCLLVSCSRASDKKPAEVSVVWLGAVPTAILQTGEQPLWFQLTEKGPVHIESIEDAVYSSALVPWTLALHVRFFYEGQDELILVINRDGFIKFAPAEEPPSSLAMYRFSGGEFWRKYTVGGFVFYDNKPAALLYLDTRFLDSSAPLPQPRTWTFNMESNNPFPLEIPALQLFPAEEGWDVDTLRIASDGYWYYRAVKRIAPSPAVRMFRSENLAESGADISIDVFYASAPRQPEVAHPLLPPLPEGFVYTGTAVVGNSLFADWEEQEDYNIGAAGFVLLKLKD